MRFRIAALAFLTSYEATELKRARIQRRKPRKPDKSLQIRNSDRTKLTIEVC